MEPSSSQSRGGVWQKDEKKQAQAETRKVQTEYKENLYPCEMSQLLEQVA